MTPRVDLDKITDELEREATVGIIHNCTRKSRYPLYVYLTPLSWADTKEAVSVSAPSAHHAGHIYATSHITARNRRGLSSARTDQTSFERYEQETSTVPHSNPSSDLGPGNPTRSIFLDSMGSIGAHSNGVVSIPPFAEEQVEWYPRGGMSDEVRIVVDRKVCLHQGSFIEFC